MLRRIDDSDFQGRKTEMVRYGHQRPSQHHAHSSERVLEMATEAVTAMTAQARA